MGKYRLSRPKAARLIGSLSCLAKVVLAKQRSSCSGIFWPWHDNINHLTMFSTLVPQIFNHLYRIMLCQPNKAANIEPV